MNRLVCLGWISKPERKENFSFETRVAPLRIQPKLQPRFLTLSPMRLSHNGYLELILTHNETRSIAVGVRNPDCSQNCRFHVREILSFWVSTRQRQNDMNGACHVIFAESHISRTRNFPYARFCQTFTRSNSP